MKPEPVIIIQARTGSTRFPSKVMAPVLGKTVLEYVVHRCSLSRLAAKLLLATSTLSQDDPVAKLGQSLGLQVYRGSESDVLDRFIGAAQNIGAEVLIRITADCPLIDPAAIDDVARIYRDSPADYVYVDGYPNGLGAAELMTLSALLRTRAETAPTDIYYREHVMTYLTDHPEKFRLLVSKCPLELRRPELRLSIDEPADLKVVQQICEYFAPQLDFNSSEIIRFLDGHPEVCALNSHVKQKTR